MGKYILICLLCSISSLGFSQAQEEPIPTTIAARFSYFWPEATDLQKIYHNGGIDYALTGTVPVYQGDCFSLRGLNAWWAVDYFQRQGKSLGLEYTTKIQVEPITAGLKWIYPKGVCRPFFGAGFKYYFVQIHNKAPNVKKNMTNNGLGCAVEIGSQFFISKHLFLDVFVAYSFKQFGAQSTGLANVRSTWLDLSGINAGGSFGVKF